MNNFFAHHFSNRRAKGDIVFALQLSNSLCVAHCLVATKSFVHTRGKFAPFGGGVDDIGIFGVSELEAGGGVGIH